MITIRIQPSEYYEPPGHMSGWRCSACGVRGNWRLGFTEQDILHTVKLADKHKCSGKVHPRFLRTPASWNEF